MAPSALAGEHTLNVRLARGDVLERPTRAFVAGVCPSLNGEDVDFVRGRIAAELNNVAAVELSACRGCLVGRAVGRRPARRLASALVLECARRITG